ncbi:hypothetical protein [Nonomuraea sp. NPDC049758]|uniref:hypothetical protein n=1 Tax=Nonomuraea sp. NPDC049758 TaxID=3154360 RepID=UPI0034459293
MPYVTAHEDETIPYRLVLAAHLEATDGLRLSYTDAIDTDWMFGALWHRHGLSRSGRPLWKLVNTGRQRRCMLHMLCQVCGRSAVDDEGRISWLMPEPPGASAAGQPFTHVPPTCSPCIPTARLLCPRLRPESHVYTARRCEPFGVVADLYRPKLGRGVVLAEEAVELPLDAFRDLEYALAQQLIVSLDGLEQVQVDHPRTPVTAWRESLHG